MMLYETHPSCNALLMERWTYFFGGEPVQTATKHDTLPKTNIAPEEWWLEDEFPFGIAYF